MTTLDDALCLTPGCRRPFDDRRGDVWECRAGHQHPVKEISLALSQAAERSTRRQRVTTAPIPLRRAERAARPAAPHGNGRADSTTPKTTAATSESERVWPELVNLLAPPDVPTLDLSLFPPEISNVALDASARIGVAVDFIAWGLLPPVATLIGPHVTLRPRQHDSWSERSCLWVVLIGDSGSGKTPALVEARHPVRRQERADEQAYQEARADADDPDSVVKVRRSVSDTTVEKLAELMNASPALLAFRDEVGGLVGSFDLYSRGESDRRFYLECYSGGSYDVDRIGRGSLRVDELYLNLLGGTQPDQAREMIGDGPRDGLAARILAIWPETPHDDPVDRSPDRAARAALDDVCDKLVSADWRELLGRVGESSASEEERPYVRLSPEAGERWQTWHLSLTRALRAGTWEGRRAERVAKYPGLAARLVLVWHLLNWAARRVTTCDLGLVPLRTVERVLTLMETYISKMDGRVYGTFDQGSGAVGATRIARWLHQECPPAARANGITAREIKRHHWSGLTEQGSVEAALEHLCTMGWLREHEPERPTRGRPSALFDVNPGIAALPMWKPI